MVWEAKSSPCKLPSIILVMAKTAKKSIDSHPHPRSFITSKLPSISIKACTSDFASAETQPYEFLAYDSRAVDGNAEQKSTSGCTRFK